jgi:hypothetical protein
MGILCSKENSRHQRDAAEICKFHQGPRGEAFLTAKSKGSTPVDHIAQELRQESYRFFG